MNHTTSGGFYYCEKVLAWLFLLSLMIPLSRPVAGWLWTRIYFFDFTLFPLLGLWGLRMVRGESFRFPLNAFDVLMALFLGWMLISNLAGIRPDKSFEAWLLFGRCFLIYLYFSRNLNYTITLKEFFIIISVLLFLEGGLALFQQITKSNIGKVNAYFGAGSKIVGLWEADKSFVRVTGTFINPNILAGWQMVLLPVVLASCFVARGKARLIVLLGICMVGGLGLAATISRSKIVAMLLGIAILLYWNRSYFWANRFRKWLTATSAIILIFVCFLVALYSGIGQGILSRFEDLSTDQEFQKKSLQRSLAFEVMASRPLLGVGQGNLAKVIKDDYPYYYRGMQRGRGPTCHNIPMKVGAESGVPALILFCGLFLYLIGRWWRSMAVPPVTLREAMSGGALISATILCFDMQWNTVFSHPAFMPLFFVLVSLPFAVCAHQP